MIKKTIDATEAKNKFGKVLEAVQNHTVFIVERRGTAKAIMLSCDELYQIVNDPKKGEEISAMIRDIQKDYEVGQIMNLKDETK